jgi:hypothetical protein
MSHVFWCVMQILNYVAGGRDVSANITFMCQTIIRGLAAPLVKKLAYDVVHAAPLSDGNWSIVIEGLKSDIVGTFSLEVRLLSILAHQISHIHLYHLNRKKQVLDCAQAVQQAWRVKPSTSNDVFPTLLCSYCRGS